MGHSRSCWLVTLVAGVVLVACDGAPVPTDAGPPGDASIQGAAMPMPPMPPASVVFGPCPPGWRAITTAAGAMVCDPWPATGASDTCAFDEVHLPGTPGCARLGTACASDGWPSDLPTGRTIVYVDDDAAAGGDGASRATAFHDIVSALALAPTGAVIAIATGRYDERQLSLAPGQTLWGACVDGTRITSSFASDDQMLIDAAEIGVGVRNLAIDSPARFAIAISGGDVTVQDVVIEHAHGIGFYSMVGTSTLRGIAVRNTQPVSDGRLGDGIWLVGGSATIERAVLDHNREYALYLSPGSSAEVSDVSARRTQALASDGYYGHGFGVEQAHLMLHRAAVEHNLEVGIELLGAGSAALTDVVVRDTMPGPDGAGWGVSAPEGATITFDRLYVAASHALGVAGDGAGTTITGHDLVVEDTETDGSDGTAGFGVASQHGAQITITRAFVAGSHEVGVFATDDGSRLALTDVRVNDTTPSTRLFGFGAIAQAGAHLTLTRASIDGATGAGFGATAGGVLEATDTTVTGTRASADGAGGDGLVVTQGGTARLERGRIASCFEVGAIAIASTLTLVDVSIEDIASRASDGLFGRGIEASHGATIDLTRVHVLRAHDDGAILGGPGTTVTSTDLIVEDTRAQTGNLHGGIGIQIGLGARTTFQRTRIDGAHMAGIAALGGTVDVTSIVVTGVHAAECAATTCADLGGGFGVIAQGGAAVTLHDFDVEDAQLCGVVVGLDATGTGGTIDLHHGQVRMTPIGACVQVPGFDTERLHDGVQFVNVTVPLQATSYALPAADDALSH